MVEAESALFFQRKKQVNQSCIMAVLYEIVSFIKERERERDDKYLGLRQCKV